MLPTNPLFESIPKIKFYLIYLWNITINEKIWNPRTDHSKLPKVLDSQFFFLQVIFVKYRGKPYKGVYQLCRLESLYGVKLCHLESLYEVRTCKHCYKHMISWMLHVTRFRQHLFYCV